MKAIKNITSYIVAGAMALLSSCEPIEERDTLKNSFNPDDIELAVVQSSNGTGNGLTLKMNTPGVYGYWDIKLDKKFSNEATFISPFKGNLTFTYYVTTPYIKNGNLADREYISKSINVNVQVADNRVNDKYYALVGENLEGKTWVFDGAGGDNRLWWFMSDPGNPWGTWWNAGGTCCPPGDVTGQMKFDLNGAANFTYFANPNATGVATDFRFNSDFSKLYIGGGRNILGAGFNGSGNAAGEYTVVELTANKMVLHTNKNGAGTGWTWVFVPKP